MADIALVTAGKIEVVESIIQATLPVNEDVTAGDLLRIDVTTGHFTRSNGSSAGEADTFGVATRTVKNGMPVTAIRKGVLAGFNLAAQGYSATLYASNTDGKIADAAGTVSKVVGKVIPVWGQLLGASPDKLLFVDL
jgi:hypothetical protein